MSPIAIAAIIMLVLLFLNVPVFASVLGACVTYFVLNPSAGLDGMLAMQRVISGIQSVPMLAIPFFVAAGALMNYCGITDRMLKFCKVLTGHMYGGPWTGKYCFEYPYGWYVRFLSGGCGNGSEAACTGYEKSRISKRVCICYHRIFFNDHTFDPAGNRSDYLRKCNRNFYRPPVCGRYCSCCHPLRGR